MRTERGFSRSSMPEPSSRCSVPLRLRTGETLYKLLSFSSQLSTAPPKSPANAGPGGSKDDDFYANVGNAIRTLRAEIPRLFQQDFTCEFSPSAIQRPGFATSSSCPRVPSFDASPNVCPWLCVELHCPNLL